MMMKKKRRTKKGKNEKVTTLFDDGRTWKMATESVNKTKNRLAPAEIPVTVDESFLTHKSEYERMKISA